MVTLAETFSHKGITLETVTAYVRYYIDAHGQEVWQHHLTEIEQRYQQAGNKAYGLYSQTLFRPLEEELRAAGLIPICVLTDEIQSQVTRSAAEQWYLLERDL